MSKKTKGYPGNQPFNVRPNHTKKGVTTKQTRKNNVAKFNTTTK